MGFEDALGDRMKAYEAVETSRRLNPSTGPVYARIDGRGFSNLTRSMRRPFDERMSGAMVETARRLVDETGAAIGYTQSDEVSLLWSITFENENSQMFFDGKVTKLVGVLSGLATAAFTRAVATSEPEFAKYAEKLPHFDARVFQLPDLEEGVNALIWRGKDATRNAVQSAAYARYSPATTHRKSTNQLREMLAADGIDFAAYPAAFRCGTYLRRVAEMRELTPGELASIPEGKRPAPGHLVMRKAIREIDMESLVEVENRIGVVFAGEEPVFRVREGLDAPAP